MSRAWQLSTDVFPFAVLINMLTGIAGFLLLEEREIRMTAGILIIGHCPWLREDKVRTNATLFQSPT